MQVPSNLFLNKIGKPAIYLPTVMIVWGIISAATAAANSYGGLLAIRFCLGFVEAAYFPGCLYFLSCWYKRSELGLRTAMLYSGSLLSGAFSGLIAAGILSGLNGARGIAAWYVHFPHEHAEAEVGRGLQIGVLTYIVWPGAGSSSSKVLSQLPSP